MRSWHRSVQVSTSRRQPPGHKQDKPIQPVAAVAVMLRHCGDAKLRPFGVLDPHRSFEGDRIGCFVVKPPAPSCWGGWGHREGRPGSIALIPSAAGRSAVLQSVRHEMLTLHRDEVLTVPGAQHDRGHGPARRSTVGKAGIGKRPPTSTRLWIRRPKVRILPPQPKPGSGTTSCGRSLPEPQMMCSDA